MIVTLTLNPAFDVHCQIQNLIPLKENFATVISKEAGGKGLNVSRALGNSGVENTALIIVGKSNEDAFKKKATSPLVNCEYVSVDGNIRENYTLHHQDGKETRISFDGFTCPDGIVDLIKEKLSLLCGGDVVAVTGSISKGIDKDKIICLLKELKEKGVKIIIDSRSFTLSDIQEIKPWFIKPNNQEIEEYLGVKVNTVEEGLKASQTLYGLGVQNAMVSLGGLGAVITSDNKSYYIKSPTIEVKSTIGAGDSLIAGYIHGYVKGLNNEEWLKTAIAFGTGACLTQGTNPPSMQTILEIKEKVQIYNY